MILRLTIAIFALLVFGVAAADPVPRTLHVTGAVSNPHDWTESELRALPVTHERVFFHTGHGALVGDFSGTLLWPLLQTASIKTDKAVKNDLLRHVVIVTGSDGYSVTLSLGEIDPEHGGDAALLALDQDGKALPAKDGFVRLIVPGDKAASRCVGSVASIELR